VRFLLTGAFALTFAAVVVGWLVPARLRLAAWTLVIVIVVVPWSGWVGHEHWARVIWVPFMPPLRLRDVVLNVIFYVPFGLFFPQGRRGAGKFALAVGCAFLLSVATELTQVYSHGRFPSMTDVATNTIGAAVGAGLARLRRWS
jgi:glycopeptide antibiotics resistance protein